MRETRDRTGVISMLSANRLHFGLSSARPAEQAAPQQPQALTNCRLAPVSGIGGTGISHFR
jgi:hypothetical protein